MVDEAGREERGAAGLYNQAYAWFFRKFGWPLVIGGFLYLIGYIIISIIKKGNF